MTGAEPRLEDTGRGYTITYRGRALYSPADPRGAAVRRVKGLALQSGTLIFVPSVGLGYGLPELLEKLPDSCHVLCVEVDERLFKLALERAPSLPRGEKLTVIRTSRPDQAAAAACRLGLWRFRRLVPLHLCGAYRLYRREYRELQQALEEEIRLYWQNKLTLMAMADLWLKNLFTNIGLLPRSGDIRDLSTKRPILVTGAGPSLDSSLEWIGAVRNRVILLASDTSLPVLGAVGLAPDWVFTLDAQIHTLGDFLPFREPGIKVLCDLTSNPQALRLFPELFFFSTRFHHLSLFDRLERASLLPTPLPPRGSVGVSAVEAALLLTTGPVLFTGLDFSYANGQTHARGTPSHLAGLSRCSRLEPCGMIAFGTLLSRPRMWQRGKTGGRLLTDLVLFTYARQLAAINAASRRSFDLGREGLPVGAGRIASVAELAAVCGRDADSSGTSGPAGPGARAGGTRPSRARPAAGGIRSFYENERALLSAVIGGTPGTPREFPGLTSVEYLFLAEPEVEPERLLTSANLERVKARAAKFSLHLRRCLERLEATA
jgi:hypothetical protein